MAEEFDAHNPVHVHTALGAIGARSFGQRVTIIRDKKELRTKSGLYLATSEKDVPDTKFGIVVDLGPNVDLDIRLYDRIGLSSYIGGRVEIELPGNQMVEVEVLHQDEVFFAYPSKWSKEVGNAESGADARGEEPVTLDKTSGV